jgi:hypothetical protein
MRSLLLDGASWHYVALKDQAPLGAFTQRVESALRQARATAAAKFNLKNSPRN